MNRQVNDLASELDLGFSGPVLSFGPAFGLAVAIFALLLFYWNDRKVRSGAQKVRPESLAVLGMVRTFQLTKSLTKLSVIENMRLGATDQKGEKWWNGLFAAVWNGQEAEITERADELLTRFKMDHMRDEYAGSLSGGQRKLLEMARALMTNPTLVMLDEPMAGVNPALKQSLNQHIRGLRDDGMTVLFVEHDMDMVHDVSDWVIVMAEGRIIAEGTPDDISSNPAVIDAYLGTRQGQSLLEGE
jgi:branched-chain amino acid transport system ATP-binding protein